MSTATRTRLASPRRRPQPLPAGFFELEHVEAWRTWRGMSKSELARVAGVGWPTIQRAEQGKVTGPVVAAIAYALGIPVEMLMHHSPRDDEACQWIARHIHEMS